ncbi:MAG: hypothetical protein IPK16_24370 [Anaerolineales bacterium]|nr:hypothetical protein [Anaerolineales bacterium]
MINRRRLLSTAYLGYDVMRATIAPVGIGVRMMLVRDNSVLLVYHSYVSRWFFPGGSMKRNETPGGDGGARGGGRGRCDRDRPGGIAWHLHQQPQTAVGPYRDVRGARLRPAAADRPLGDHRPRLF